LAPKNKLEFANNADNYVAYYRSQWEDVLEVAALALPYMDKVFGNILITNILLYRAAMEAWNTRWLLY